ncbi:MAG: cytochrome c biogenesis protein CcdA [Betaproteobacteria bacterium]|nr:cytochrome c biogenesis protein CcdA [Betaproteobacteria bacterium]
MLDASNIGLVTAFAAGLVSFLSPCVLPLVPGYVSYVAGHSMHGDRPNLPARGSAVLMSLFFVTGFSAVFIAFGASATALGQVLLKYRYEANLIGGAIVTAFGLFMIGLMNRVTWIHRDLRFHPHLKGGRPAAAFVLGLAFGFGWTPCIGPVLGAILTVAAVSPAASDGVPLLGAYAAGLGVPFVAAALFTGAFVQRLRFLRHLGRPLQVAAGLLMIVMGIAIATGQLSAFSYWLLRSFPGLGRIG